VLIVGTETGILHRLKQENPETEYVPVAEKAVCPNMKRIDLAKVLLSLERMEPRIEIPEGIRRRALDAVEKMIAL
jgi:quinolinate synthase